MSAGVETAGLRKKLLAFCAVLSGSAVALSGVIGFVDLIAPHAARKTSPAWRNFPSATGRCA
jgi:iron complex transport system permease protein